jgi:dipeptidase E
MHRMNLYFIGGGSVEQGELVRIDRAILSDIGVPHPVVLVIPWTDPDTKRRRLYEAMLGEYFVCLGAGKVIFARLRDSHQTLRNKFGEAHLVYLPGGDTECLLEAVRNKGISRLISSCGKPVVGNSAGALAMCRKVVLTSDECGGAARIVRGFGLVDFSVEVHYDRSEDEELMELSKNRRIYAVPERSCLCCHGRKLSAMGRLWLFRNGRKVPAFRPGAQRGKR